MVPRRELYEAEEKTLRVMLAEEEEEKEKERQEMERRNQGTVTVTQILCFLCVQLYVDWKSAKLVPLLIRVYLQLLLTRFF